MRFLVYLTKGRENCISSYDIFSGIAARSGTREVSLNVLHKNAVGGSREAEEELFESLTARFRLFAQHKIRDKADSEEVVQDQNENFTPEEADANGR